RGRRPRTHNLGFRMDKIRVRGGNPLQGQIVISGAKNAALPLMAAALLAEEPVTLVNVPRLADIDSMAHLLVQLGVEVAMSQRAEREMKLTASDIRDTTAPYDLVRKMRASVLVLGPLLVRTGRADVSLPGGCAIGTRPIDLHLKALAELGAEIELRSGYVRASAPKGRLKGAKIVFPKVSVGATENLLMAATLAEGETVIVNAAREPEIGDLARCLTAMGARIEGIDTETLRIRGVERLHGCRHRIIPDRVETGTYMMAAAIANGDVELVGASLDHVGAIAKVLQEAGLVVDETNRGIHVRTNGAVIGVDVMTEP